MPVVISCHLVPRIRGVQAQSLPTIGSPQPVPYLGQWDYIPVESPDREAARIVTVRPGLIWLVTNGRVMSLIDQQLMRPLELPKSGKACAEDAGLQILPDFFWYFYFCLSFFMRYLGHVS